MLPAPLYPVKPLGWRWPWMDGEVVMEAGAAAGPRISVVIPSYNQGRYLEAALRSVLLQDYANKEVIVTDGGSSDESVEVLHHYEPWLRYWVSEKDRGQAHAINKGLAVAQGDILTFLNSDDLQAPGALRRVAQAARRHPAAAVFHGHRVLIDEHQSVLGWACAPEFEPLVHGYTIASETAYWRREAPGAAHGFDESLQFALDMDFFCRLHRHGGSVRLDHFLGIFRCHADAKSARLQDVCERESALLWKRHFEREPVRGRPGESVGRAAALWSMARNPSLVLWPYLLQRLRRGGFLKT